MAAGYSTNSASGPIDLLQKLVTFLVAQGWTSDSSVTYGSGWRAHLHKNGLYVNLRAFVGEAVNITTGWGTGFGSSTAGYGIGLYLGTGYSGAAAWNAQAGGPLDNAGTQRIGCGMILGSGAVPTYHFLDDGQDNVTVVVDTGSGLTRHMGWGPTLVKTGYSSDHWYFFGSQPAAYNVYGDSQWFYGTSLPAMPPMSQAYATSGQYYALAFVRTDAAVYTNRWLGFTNMPTSSASYGGTGRAARCAHDACTYFNNDGQVPKLEILATRGNQTAFTGSLILPLHCYAQSAASRWIPLGYPRSVFFCPGVGHGLNSGQVYAVGGLNYLVFTNFAVLKAA